MLCDYFQACIPQSRVWFVTAVLRSCEHVAFDRTIDAQKSIFEFFVAPDSRETFVALMSFFQAHALINNLVELPNRLHVQGEL